MRDRYFKNIVKELFYQTYTYRCSYDHVDKILFPRFPLGYNVSTIMRCVGYRPQSFASFDTIRNILTSTYGIHKDDTERIFDYYLKYIRENVDSLPTKHKGG